MSNENRLHPIPKWMHIDTRPLDHGEFKRFGYGYTRPVTSYERWRPATRYIRRLDAKGQKGFTVLTLMPGYYYVSDHGRIWCARYGRMIHYRKHSRSRTELVLADGSTARIRPYKLALDNFVEPPEKIRNVVYYLLEVVNHLDLKPWNNRLNNLEYSNQSNNMAHSRSTRKKQESLCFCNAGLKLEEI